MLIMYRECRSYFKITQYLKYPLGWKEKEKKRVSIR